MITTSTAAMHFPFQDTEVSRLARIIGLLTLAAALASCSAVKLGYNNLGDLAYWWLDSYVDLDDEQGTRVREDLARLHAWHRTEELPRLAQMLHRMEELASGDITAAQACVFAGQVRERLTAVAGQGEAAAIALASTLSAEQLQHIERKYGRNNAEYRRQWVRRSPAEVVDRRVRQFLDRSENLYGSLNDSQRKLLRRELEQSTFDPQRNLAERMRRQQDALETLRRIAGEPLPAADARALLRGYLARVQEPPDPVQRQYQQQVLDEACRTFATLHNSTSMAQRQSAVRRLRAYQRDLRDLASSR
jgi:hypothetical protein